MSDRDQHETPRRRVSMRTAGWIVVAVLLVTFILQNTEKAQVKFLFLDIESGVWFALIVALAIGGAIGYVAGRHNRSRRDHS